MWRIRLCGIDYSSGGISAILCFGTPHGLYVVDHITITSTDASKRHASGRFRKTRFSDAGPTIPCRPPNLAGNQSESAIAGPLPLALLESLSPPAADGGGRGEGFDA
jgi:hypothetical protein